MNPRQRRGVFFLALAVLGAVGVFFATLSYVNGVEAKVGPMVTAYVVNDDVAAYQPVTSGDVKKVEVPEKWRPEHAVTDLGDLDGQVASSALSAGDLLQDANLVAAPKLRTGEYEVAVLADARSGVAGRVATGDHVDVWATFEDEVTNIGPRTKLIAENVPVIDVGLQTTRERTNERGATLESDAIPVTFATTEGQVKALDFANTFAANITLARRGPTDETTIPPKNRTYEEPFEVTKS